MAETEWRCDDCGCKSFARVDEPKYDGSFGPGPQVRCVNCKAVTDFPVSKPPHQEEGDVERISRDLDDLCEGDVLDEFQATAILQAMVQLQSQASQIEALRKERDEARLCQQQIAAGSNQSATVARIIIAKNEADGRAEAAEKKIEELMNAR